MFLLSFCPPTRQDLSSDVQPVGQKAWSVSTLANRVLSFAIAYSPHALK